mmetsp:Transcript_111493/g.193239  ORF Transcript_111493/g.193239 Transcript_111493/m.193239 type:complete len:1055 (-) Transcript_111493:179-3343(-)
MRFGRKDHGATGLGEAPLHVSPQSPAHMSRANLETFANTGGASSEHLLNMADISQQTLVMHQLRQASQASAHEVRRGASAADRLPSPRRVGCSLSRPGEATLSSVQQALEPRQVEISSQSMLGADQWASQKLPHHVQTSAPGRELEGENHGRGYAESSAATEEWKRFQAQQSAPQLAQTMQLLQCFASQMGPFEGDFLQQTIQEIAKQCAPDGTPGWGGMTGAPTPGVAPVNHAWGWGSAQQCATNQRSKGGEDTFDIDQRIEELNVYIRQQAQEYTEGQAEWSRQIAEVRGECQRELDRVKREKEKVERQARQELMRLNQRLREHGIKDEIDGVHSSPESAFRQVSAWSTDVSMEEYQQAQRKTADAEERVRQLEQYIKDQSAKHLMNGYAQLKEKDDEIQKLKQVIVANGLELQQANAELQALRVQYEHKVHFWDQGARRLLSVAEQFLRQRNDRGGSEEERRENGGHFGRTATKLSLTLCQGKEGGDVGSLRRLLKDALTQSATSDGKNGRAKKAARRAKDEGKAEQSHGEEPATEPKLEETKPEEPDLEDSKPVEGDCSSSSTHWTPSLLAAAPTSTALSDSNASSRETSPGRDTLQVVGRNDVSLGYCVGDAAQSPGVMHFLSQLANEIRQLLAMSQQPGPCAPSPAGSPVPSAQASPRSSGLGSPFSGSSSSRALSPLSPPTGGQLRSLHTAGQAHGDRGRVQQILDAMLPARKGIAQNIITVEKMLRSLERDLRKQCEELLGQEDLQVELLHAAGSEGGAASDEEAAYNTAAEDEARRHVPFLEDGQIFGISALRRAQWRSSTLLAQFVQLPQKLKEVFDLTKKLGIEVNGLVPSSMLSQAEANASWAKMVEQRHAFHVELLQKRLQTMTSQVAELQRAAGDGQPLSASASKTGLLTPPQEAAEDQAASDAQAVAEKIREDADRGVSQEEQLVAAHTKLRQLTRELSNQGVKVRSLEEEVVNLHLSRYTERAQNLAFMQQSAGLQKPPTWPWCMVPPPSGTSPDVADQVAAAAGAAAGASALPFRLPCQQAWGPSSPGLLPTATCVA